MLAAALFLAFGVLVGLIIFDQTEKVILCVCGHHRWQHWFIIRRGSYCLICGVRVCDEWRPRKHEEET